MPRNLGGFAVLGKAFVGARNFRVKYPARHRRQKRRRPPWRRSLIDHAVAEAPDLPVLDDRPTNLPPEVLRARHAPAVIRGVRQIRGPLAVVVVLRRVARVLVAVPEVHAAVPALRKELEVHVGRHAPPLAALVALNELVRQRRNLLEGHRVVVERRVLAVLPRLAFDPSVRRVRVQDLEALQDRGRRLVGRRRLQGRELLEARQRRKGWRQGPLQVVHLEVQPLQVLEPLQALRQRAGSS